MTELRRRLFLALLGVFEAMTRRDGHQVLFTSDSRADLSGNLKIVHDRMVERGLGRRYRLRTLFKPSVSAGRGWRDRLRLPRLLAGSDVILLDDYQPIIYRFTPPVGVRVIQLWHASGAFKTVGYSRVGKPGGPSPYSMTHKNYTHAIVSSDHDVPYYAEAFGIPEERVVPTGIPRMDRFFDEQARAAGLGVGPRCLSRDRGAHGDPVRADLPRQRTPQRVLRHRPRSTSPRSTRCASRRTPWSIIRMHPFVREPLAIPAALRDRLLDGSRGDIDVNDLLFGVDLLVTDYSSIVFEYSTLGRPMLFFAYDLEEYVATRDFYVPFEKFVPGRIVRTFPELLDAIRHDDYQVEKVAAFAGRHFAHLDGVGGPRHRPADPGPMRRPASSSSASVLVRAAFAVARLLPLRRRVVLATAHAARLGGNLAFIRDELRGRPPGGTGRGPRPSAPLPGCEAGSRPRARRCWPAITWPPRGCSWSTTTSSRSTSCIHAPGPRSSRPGTPRGAFKKVGYSVLDKSFGADALLTGRVRIHANYDICLVPSQSAAAHYAEAFRLPLDRFVSRLGIPRTDLFFDAAARWSAPRAAIRGRYAIAPGRRVILYAPTFRGDSDQGRACDRRPRPGGRGRRSRARQ